MNGHLGQYILIRVPSLKNSSKEMRHFPFILESLAIEIYKFVNGLSPEMLNSVFHLKNNNLYSLRNVYKLYSRNPRTVKYGTETILYLVPKIWSIVPQTIKGSTSIYSFKTKIKKWKPDCPCRRCKRCLQHVGFL